MIFLKTIDIVLPGGRNGGSTLSAKTFGRTNIIDRSHRLSKSYHHFLLMMGQGLKWPALMML